MKINQIILFYILALFNLPSWAFPNSNDEMSLFTSEKYHYSIRYPRSWKPHDLGKGVVVFRGKSNHPVYAFLVNIQTIYTKNAGGHYATIKDLMDDFQSQVPLHTERAAFLKREPLPLAQPDGTTRLGESTTLIFHENGQTLKHWQVMFMSQDGRLFQAWAYRAPLQYFDINYPRAAEMLASWVIQ